MKLEKSKWKVREIGFLEVVIRLEEIKIEKGKIKRVLDWPIPKEVKNIQIFLELINYYQQFIKDFTAIAMLRSMPPGVNMDKGKGYDDNNRLRCSSLSQRLMW